MSQPANSSGLKSSSAAITTKPARLVSVIAIADGTNAATVTIYDAASATGTALAQIIVDAGLTYEMFQCDDGVMANTAIYCDISGTGAKAIVHYKLGS